MKRAYKYRFYPTPSQQEICAQTFRSCRFIYNWGLSTRKTAFFQHGQRLSYRDLAAMLQSDGFLVPAIRYPTVAKGAARLRITVTAAHEEAQIEALCETIKRRGC